MKKNLLTLLIIILSVICGGNNLSAQDRETKSGTWGGIDWTLTTDGTLTIAPTTKTEDEIQDPTNPKRRYKVGDWREAVVYKNGSAASIGGWPYERAKVKKLIIEEGVTSIGSFAAQSFTNLTGEVVIPSTVTYIGQEAFQKSTMSQLTFAEGGKEQPLCIAQGAFKNLIIKELILPADRPDIHLHAWMFLNSTKLEYVYFPANVSGFTGTNHVDYNNNPNAQTEGNSSSGTIINYTNTGLVSIVFGSEEIKNLYVKSSSFPNGCNSYVIENVVAKIGQTPYSSLQDAINDAQDGDEIVVVKDINFTDDDVFIAPGTNHKVLANVSGKNITLNLNGKTLSVDYNGGNYLIAVIRVDDGASLTVTGNGTIDISKNGITVAYMFWKAGTTGKLIIENGTFHMDDSGDSMVYTNGNEIVTINGGRFTIDNVATRDNGFPCIFNAQGNNAKHVIVNGGTFNYDILHQYWIFEVKAPKERALRNNGDGTYTMVDAVAWIDEKHSGHIKNVGYTTLEEAFAAAHKYNTQDYTYTVNVIANSTVQSPINVTENVNLNLGGNHNVTASLDKMISIKNGAEMNVNGSGRLTNNGGNVFFVENGNLTINDGNFAGNGNIIDCDNNNYNTTAKATIYYGRFFNWDPEDNTAEGEGTNFCADGHISIDNHDGSYSVIHGDNIAYLVGKARYNSLQEAINNAVNNDVIMVLQDFTTSSGDLLELDTNLDTYFMIANKTVTIDLNGKRIYSEYAAEEGRKLAGVFSTKGTGNLTINNSNEEYESVVEAKASSPVNALITNYDNTANTTINGGKYILDNAQDCLVFSDGNGTTINGGYYTLGNANEKPIFNTIGENQYILVNDGTFNANILNQEVNIPLTKFLQNNNNGTWTIIDAIAWVKEYTRENVYASLNDAYAQAQDGDVITLINNTEENGIKLNKNVTINFDGKSCSFTNNNGLVIPAGKTITLTGGTLNAENADYVISTSGNLTMQDMTINGTVEYLGGEMFTNKSFKVSAKKDFDGIGAVQGQKGWSTISTPIADALIPEATAGTHDLYRFDEPEQEWEYYNDADGQTFKKLELGRGYLYANAENITLELEGNLNVASIGPISLNYTEGNSLAGFNFIGNPFTHTITRSNIKTSPSMALSTGFYVVGANGTWIAKTDSNDKIAPMESVLIKANGPGDLIIHSNNGSKRAARNESSYLTVKVASKTHSDVTHISFNEGMGLDKISHRNPDNPMIYIPVDGKNYAIAMMNQDVKEVPVHFNANRMAEYTISIEQKNCEFSSVVLVDKLTGVETNLLIEDYSFMARSFDNADRFIIRLSIEDYSDSESDNFAFISNGQMIIEEIEGQGVVRIFDIMGRHISQHSVSGSASIATDGFATGMYIIQMSDDNGVKVQKIIID